MDQITEVNCTTGEVVVRDPTPEEIEQATIDAANAAKTAAANAAAEKKRGEIIAALAKTLGVKADEVKGALNIP